MLISVAPVPDYNALWWMLSLTSLVGSVAVDVHVSTISIAEQGLSEAPLHLEEVFLITPISTMSSMSSLRGSGTICSHGCSLAALPARKIFRIGL